jgi:hypothetical protein
MARETNYKQLRDGTWGISGINLVPGTTVTVTKKSRETKREVVGEIVWKSSDGFCYAKIAQGQTTAPAAKSAPKSRTTTRTSTRRSSRRTPKSEGSKDGKYSSSREGDQGDEVGRVCYLKYRGSRIPVVVVGYETGYCTEDGLSFGLPMDEGYYTTSWYRDATTEETSALAAKEAAKVSAKEASEKAAKEALGLAEKTARAPLEGLSRSDSLDTPKGNRTQVGSFKNSYNQNVTVTKIELEDGRVAYNESFYMFDDGREYLWATEEVLASLYEERLAERPITLEQAQEYLSMYGGCYWSDIYKYIVSKHST